MSTKVYFDTDCFHHFATVFECSQLADDLRDRILLSPITMIEVLSHLARGWRGSVHRQLIGIPNWQNRRGVGVLPFMDTAISIIGFGATLSDDGYTKRLQADINVCVSGEAEDLLAIATVRDVELKEVKKSYADTFEQIVAHFRSARLTESAFKEAWVSRFLKDEAANQQPRTQDQIVATFSALYEYEYEKLKLAVSDPNYKPHNHQNDLFDAEQLIYLGDEDLHFITLDGGYLRKVLKSPQRTRIHQASVSDFRDPTSAENLVRNILRQRTSQPSDLYSTQSPI
jgi:hypothetical protein